MTIEQISEHVNTVLRVLVALITVILIGIATKTVLQIADANERIATQLEQQADPFAWDNL